MSGSTSAIALACLLLTASCDRKPRRAPNVALDPAASSVATCPSRYAVADSDAVTVRARILDANGTPVRGATVHFAALEATATLTPASARTDADGAAAAALTTTMPGKVSVRVGVEQGAETIALAAQPSVEFLARPLGPSEATLAGRQLLLRRRLADGSLAPSEPLAIRGVAWAPASRTTATSPADPRNVEVRRPEFAKWRAVDLPLIRAMNANTVRLYFDPGLDCEGVETLNQIFDAGLLAIVTVDAGINDLDRAAAVVRRFANHPAILAWSLGNEININRYYGVAPTIADAVNRTQAAAALVRSIDATHPIVASWGDIDIDAEDMRLQDTRRHVTVCADVDGFSVNAFRGPTFDALFLQWRSITAKPMFLGEFGTDAWRTGDPRTPETGFLDAAMQAQWHLGLWTDLSSHLSASDAARTCLGGVAFEFVDEWWKVTPSGTQDHGGFQVLTGHPDFFANEDWFGLADVDRVPRAAYHTLRDAFAAHWTPPPPVATFRVRSAGGSTGQVSYGLAEFSLDGRVLFSRDGGGGGGRGFNMCALDPRTGYWLHAPENYDTWGTRHTGSELMELVEDLDRLQDGALVLLAIADDAGLNPDNSCAFFGSVSPALARLQSLGSTRIQQYCFRDSWAMIAFKGRGRAEAESLVRGAIVDLRARLEVP